MMRIRTLLATAMEVPESEITEDQCKRAMQYALRSLAEVKLPEGVQKDVGGKLEIKVTESKPFDRSSYVNTLAQMLNEGMDDVLLLKLRTDIEQAQHMALESVRNHQYPQAIIACAAARMHTEKVFSD